MGDSTLSRLVSRREGHSNPNPGPGSITGFLKVHYLISTTTTVSYRARYVVARVASYCR